jgi:HEAT repeat protein
MKARSKHRLGRSLFHSIRERATNTFRRGVSCAFILFTLAGAPPILCQSPAPDKADTSLHAETPPQNKTEPKTTQPEAKPLSPWQMLVAGATNHNVARRQEAIAALGTMNKIPRAVRLVESALEDTDPSVRQLAASDLGQMHARSSIPQLKKALNDDSTGVSFAAAKSLWLMGNRSGRDVLLGILSGDKSSSGLVKGEVQSAKKMLEDPRGLAVIGAKEAATSLFGPAGWGIKIVEEVTKDRSASARAMSAALLSHDATPDVLQELDDALFDKNWIVREAAAQALGATRARDQVVHLEPLLQDQKPAVGYMAAASIIRLSGKRLAVLGRASPSKSLASVSALQTQAPGKDKQ